MARQHPSRIQQGQLYHTTPLECHNRTTRGSDLRILARKNLYVPISESAYLTSGDVNRLENQTIFLIPKTPRCD